MAAVFIWGVVEIISIFVTFVFFFWFNNGLLDLILFATTATLMTQNLFFLLLLSFSLDSEGGRGRFWKTGMLSSMAPLLFWPGMLFAYTYHAYSNRSKYTTVSYIVTKYLLFFLFNLTIANLSFECMFPAYAWYQALARLADKVPYDRPTEEEVEAADVVPKESVEEQEFDIEADIGSTEPEVPEETLP